MTLLEQLRGNFPKTIDKSKKVFSSIIANDKKDASIQKQLNDLFNYMKEWISTPNVYKQTGTMLDKTVKFFSFLERFADETETSLKNRFAAIFIRNHDNKWGTVYDVKSVFRQYFPHAVIYLVENTNKIDDSVPEYANLITDGDINTDTPTAWTLVDCSATKDARFSKAYGMELDQVDGYFEQTVTVLNRKIINEEEPYEYKNLTYFLHFFLSGSVNVKIFNAANNKYWDNQTKTWSSTEVQSRFENAEWNDCSLYFITEGDDDEADITITFAYDNTPVKSGLENTLIKGKVVQSWNPIDCNFVNNIYELYQASSSVNTSNVTIIPEKEYKLNFESKGRLQITVKNNNNKYWNFEYQKWQDSPAENVFTSSDWSSKTVSFTPNAEDSSVDISYKYFNSRAFLRNNSNLEGILDATETLTDCTVENGVIHMEQISSAASYVTDVVSDSVYTVNYNFSGRTAVIIKNDNYQYWDILAQKWSSTAVKNIVMSNSLREHSFGVKCDGFTNQLTITFEMPNSYLDYFRLFEKQPFSSFTVMAHFEGNTSVGVFGLAAGDDDPNMETEDETPPQPRYGNYGYYDKSFLSGLPIGFASDIYEDLLDYLRAQGVKAYFEIIVRDYSGE